MADSSHVFQSKCLKDQPRYQKAVKDLLYILKVLSKSIKQLKRFCTNVL